MSKILDWRWILGIYLVAITVLLTIALFSLWPQYFQKNNISEKTSEPATIVDKIYKPDSTLQITSVFRPDIAPALKDTNNLHIKISSDSISSLDSTNVLPSLGTKMSEHRLLWLMLIIGALGASLQGLISLAAFVGNKSFSESWVLWYFLRPFIGGILSILFYFIIRGGFLTEIKSAESLHGLVAFGGLIGLFSKQATNKLNDIFNAILPSKQDDELGDKLTQNNPAPSSKT